MLENRGRTGRRGRRSRGRSPRLHPPRANRPGAFKIGELSAQALRDGELELPNDNKVFGVGRTPAEVAAVLSAAGQPTDKLQLNIHPLLVKTADRVLLFDTGAGANFGPGAGKLAGLARGSGCRPATASRTSSFRIHTAITWAVS